MAIYFGTRINRDERVGVFSFLLEYHVSKFLYTLSSEVDTRRGTIGATASPVVKNKKKSLKLNCFLNKKIPIGKEK